jgi:hypothetical protein
MTFPRWLAGGAVVFVCGALFWFPMENSSPPEAGASFAGLAWIVLGPPISLLLYPFAYLLVQKWKSPLRYVALPAVLLVAVVAAMASTGDLASWQPGDSAQAAWFAVLMLASWVAYLAIMERRIG